MSIVIVGMMYGVKDDRHKWFAIYLGPARWEFAQGG